MHAVHFLFAFPVTLNKQIYTVFNRTTVHPKQMCILNYFSWPSLFFFFTQHFILAFTIILTLSLTCSSLNRTGNRFRPRESKTTLEKQHVCHDCPLVETISWAKTRRRQTLQRAYFYGRCLKIILVQAGGKFVFLTIWEWAFQLLGALSCFLPEDEFHPCLLPRGQVSPLPPQAQCNTWLFSQFLITKL